MRLVRRLPPIVFDLFLFTTITLTDISLDEHEEEEREEELEERQEEYGGSDSGSDGGDYSD